MIEVVIGGVFNVLMFVGLTVLIGVMVGRRWAQLTAILANDAAFSEEPLTPQARRLDQPLRYAA